MKYREVFLLVFVISALSICLYCSIKATADSAAQGTKVSAEEKTKQVENRTKRFPWSKK